MLVLASSSPRRAELLQTHGYKAEIFPVEVNEDLPAGLSVRDGVGMLALRKALAGVEAWRDKGGAIDDVVLGADTLVVLDGKPLGKPGSPSEARSMLQSLSGKTHLVCTGVALVRLDGKKESGVIETEVTFRPLFANEIHAYVAGGEPFDKAGGYGIQGEGGRFVERFTGSLSNVIGLPMEYLSDRLKAWGID